MKTNSIPSIWTAQEKVIHLCRWAIIFLGLVTLTLVAILLTIHFQNPIVVVENGHEIDFYPTQRKPLPLEKPQVEEFTKKFLASLYVWPVFLSQKIERSIQPFCDEGLSKKVVGTQSQRYLKELQGKHLAQSIAFVEVSVLSDRVVAKFDRILKIEGLPVVIPTEVMLSLIQGDQTAFNPMGIYVSQIKESENAK